MFSSKHQQPSSIETPSSPVGISTVIAHGTTIKGDIESTGDIRIDGVLIGNLSTRAKILIGPEGVLEGIVEGQQADILGKVSGKIKIVDLVQLRASANIQGDIFAGKLQIEPSATFNGQCNMGANIVELNADLNKAIGQ